MGGRWEGLSTAQNQVRSDASPTLPEWCLDVVNNSLIVQNCLVELSRRMIKCRLSRVPAGYSGRGGSTSSKRSPPRAPNGRGPSQRIGYYGPIKKGDITGVWFSYAVAAAAAMAIALSLWLFGAWHDV
jgi:hypothetical protein